MYNYTHHYYVELFLILDFANTIYNKNYPPGFVLCKHRKTQKQRSPNYLGLFADRTGLEPATSAVTGRHSNQLNYRSKRPFPSAFALAGCKNRSKYYSGQIKLVLADLF